MSVRTRVVVLIGSTRFLRRRDSAAPVSIETVRAISSRRKAELGAWLRRLRRWPRPRARNHSNRCDALPARAEGPRVFARRDRAAFLRGGGACDSIRRPDLPNAARWPRQVHADSQNAAGIHSRGHRGGHRSHDTAVGQQAAFMFDGVEQPRKGAGRADGDFQRSASENVRRAGFEIGGHDRSWDRQFLDLRRAKPFAHKRADGVLLRRARLGLRGAESHEIAQIEPAGQDRKGPAGEFRRHRPRPATPPILVPAIAEIGICSCSRTSRTPKCAKPRENPPPSARAIPVPLFAAGILRTPGSALRSLPPGSESRPAFIALVWRRSTGAAMKRWCQRFQYRSTRYCRRRKFVPQRLTVLLSYPIVASVPLLGANWNGK